MKKTTSQIEKFLNLNVTEKKIISVCKSGFFSVADLVKKTNTPRMTVHDNLKLLEKRVLLLKRKVENQTLYSIRNIDNLFSNTDKGEKEDLIQIHQGRNSMMKIWQEIAMVPPLTRVCLLQPESSIRQSLKKVPGDLIEKLHKSYLKKNIILDAIGTEGNYSVIRENSTDGAFMSMKGRATEVNLLSKVFFKESPLEMIIFPDKVYLSDWKNEWSLEIRQPETVTFLLEMYEICKFIAKKIDHNKVMEMYLKD